tara:strand:+ start:2213 stop:2476 length:264 start_codon:yes stop_codon:yes gene_type:complete
MCFPKQKKAKITNEIGIEAINPNMDFLGMGSLRIGEQVSATTIADRAKGRRQLKLNTSRVNSLGITSSPTPQSMIQIDDMSGSQYNV